MSSDRKCLNNSLLDSAQGQDRRRRGVAGYVDRNNRHASNHRDPGPNDSLRPHVRPMPIFTPQSTRDGSATTTQRNSDISANRPGSSSPGGITKKSPSTHDK